MHTRDLHAAKNVHSAREEPIGEVKCDCVPWQVSRGLLVAAWHQLLRPPRWVWRMHSRVQCC